MPKPKAIMMGQIAVVNFDDEPDTHPFRLVIDFADAESLREAIAKQSVDFIFFE